jgi:hypothetical protein
MATEVLAQRLTVRFPGGYVIGPRATLTALLGTLNTSWTTRGGLTQSGRVRRYGSRQRSNALPGERMTVVFNSGESYSVRLVGNHVAFINAVLTGAGDSAVSMIYSERGTIYAPEVSASDDPTD